jgi:hypothetical protein
MDPGAQIRARRASFWRQTAPHKTGRDPPVTLLRLILVQTLLTSIHHGLLCLIKRSRFTGLWMGARTWRYRRPAIWILVCVRTTRNKRHRQNEHQSKKSNRCFPQHIPCSKIDIDLTALGSSDILACTAGHWLFQCSTSGRFSVSLDHRALKELQDLRQRRMNVATAGTRHSVWHEGSLGPGNPLPALFFEVRYLSNAKQRANSHRNAEGASRLRRRWHLEWLADGRLLEFDLVA